ncbi:hypothetical protein BS50DRAFT_570955, partial [Corynespora cassiicola Philippines]
MNGTNLLFENITCGDISADASSGYNWVQNADGFNTMDARSVSLKNFLYYRGDNCLAIKSRLYNIRIENITCEGGNGVTIEILGQYLEDSSVEDVSIRNARVSG